MKPSNRPPRQLIPAVEIQAGQYVIFYYPRLKRFLGLRVAKVVKGEKLVYVKGLTEGGIRTRSLPKNQQVELVPDEPACKDAPAPRPSPKRVRGLCID